MWSDNYINMSQPNTPALRENGNQTWSGCFWEVEGFLLNKEHYSLLFRATQYFDLKILVDNK